MTFRRKGIEVLFRVHESTLKLLKMNCSSFSLTSYPSKVLFVVHELQWPVGGVAL
jgi:hypothetical protein